MSAYVNILEVLGTYFQSNVAKLKTKTKFIVTLVNRREHREHRKSSKLVKSRNKHIADTKSSEKRERIMGLVFWLDEKVVRVFFFKVAEYIFLRALCWCDSVRAHGLHKTNMPSIQPSSYLLNAPTISVLFSLKIERSVLIALFLYYKGTLENISMQRTQQSQIFLSNQKNPFKCSACAVARRVVTDCFGKNVPISIDPVFRNSRHLTKKK